MATSIVAARPRAAHPQHHAVARRLTRAVKGVDERLARIIVGKVLDSIAAGPMTSEQALARFAQRVGIDVMTISLPSGAERNQGGAAL